MFFRNKNKKYNRRGGFFIFKKKRASRIYNKQQYVGRRNFARAKKNIWRALMIIFLIIIIWLAFFSPLFRIKKINITGNETISDDEINQALKPIFEKRFYRIFPGDSIIFFNEREAKDLLSKENFYFEEIKIEKKFPNSIKIEIKGKKAKLVWCQIIQKETSETSENKIIILKESQCYWLDKDGIAYSQTPDMENSEISLGFQKEDNLLVLKEKNKRINEFAKLGDKVANSEFINFAISAPQKLLKATNLKAIDFETPGAVSRELHITVSEGWKIYFDTSRDIKNQINALANVLKEEIKEEERENRFKSKR